MHWPSEKVAGIVLAAGASVRMGKTKLLLPVGNETLLKRVLNEALKSDLDKVVLVLGYQAEEIRSELDEVLHHPKLEVVKNRHYRQGISTSIIAGLLNIEDSHDHMMILLGDMPYIYSNLINLLLHRYLNAHFPIGAINVKTRTSHPVIFNRKLYHELHQLKGDVGARALIQKYSNQVCLIEPEGFFDTRDIDTPKDYAEFQRTMGEDEF